MRTTLTIEDGLIRRLRKVALERGLSLKAIVNRALHAGLDVMGAPPRRSRFRQRAHSMGLSQAVDLDKALRVASELEIEEIQRKQALRK